MPTAVFNVGNVLWSVAKSYVRTMAAKTKTKTKTSKKQASTAKMAKTAKRSHKRTKPNDKRWRPASEPSYKDMLFESWLKNPDDTLAVFDAAKKAFAAAKHGSQPPADSTLRKWLSGFSTGRDGSHGDSNYPRSARGRVNEILRALKKTGGKLHPSERKRIA